MTTNHEDSLSRIDLDERTSANAVASLVTRGDLSGLGPADRARYYVAMCDGLGLNPHSQPFEFLKLNGKEILYAKRGATDQLAAMHRITRTIVDGPKVIDLAGTKLVFCVAQATHPNGRTETSTATVPLVDPVNVLMKCETKAKRRVTLSILGLGLLDETELETIPASAQEPGARVDLPRADVRPVERKPAQLPDPRDLAPLGIEAPAQPAVAQPVEAAPIAFATPGLSKAEMTAMLATIAQCKTIADLDRERAAMRPDVSTRATTEQRTTLRKAAEAKRDALAPQPPPTGTDSPSGPRNDAATADDTHAEAAPSAEAQASIARVGDPRAYLAAKGTYTEVQRAVIAHGRHVPALCEAAVERLEALDAGDEANRRRIVAAWCDEGAQRAARATTTAAQVRRAA